MPKLKHKNKAKLRKKKARRKDKRNGELKALTGEKRD